MDARTAFDDYTARLIESISDRDGVVGLVLAGSGAEPERIDEWSDHDFFLVVDGDPEPWRRNLDWLPDHESIVLRPRETEHGLKVVYDDGHVLEFAVATRDEMRSWAANMATVAFDRGGVQELVAGMLELTTAAPEQDAADIQLFLSHILIGTGRARRGEMVAAGATVRGHAVRHLLPVWRHRVTSTTGVAADSLDPNRRFEQAYPEAAAELADALAQHPEPAARALLALAERALGAGWEHWPAEGVRAVRQRLNWT